MENFNSRATSLDNVSLCFIFRKKLGYVLVLSVLLKMLLSGELMQYLNVILTKTPNII